jgi:putative ABC transport system permease protein
MARRMASTNSVTEATQLPAATRVISGKWWPAGYAGEALVSVSEDAAKVLHVGPGSHITWFSPLRRFDSTVSAVHKTESIRLNSRVEFVFSPGALHGFPMIYYASIRVRPPDVARLQKALYQAFPTVTVVNVADVLQIIQEVVDQISLVVRFISGFAILAGVIILASSVAGTRFRRIREVVILKTLGATRRRIAGIFSVEFLILGGVAGLAGSILAAIFAALVVKRLFQVEPKLDLLPLVICVVGSALIANLAGWLASFRILDQRPLEVLRNE